MGEDAPGCAVEDLEPGAAEAAHPPRDRDLLAVERPAGGLLETHRLQAEVRRAEAELLAHGLGRDGARAGRGTDAERGGAARAVGDGDRVEHAAHPELRAERRGRQRRRGPRVARRVVVVRVRHRHEVRHLPRTRPDVPDVGGATARGREVVRRDEAATVGQYLPRGGADRQIRLGPLGTDPAVHLVTRVRIQVVVLARVERRERVGPGGDGLRAVRGGVPAPGDLPRDDAAEVPVERELVDDEQRAAAALHDEVAAVAAQVVGQWLRAGAEAQRRDEPLLLKHQPVVDDDRPRGEPQLPAPCIDDEERRGRPDARVGAAVAEEHAHRLRVPRLELRPGVVVGKDPAVVPAVTGGALGTPLRHADAVSPPASVEQEDRSRRRCRRQQQPGGDRKNQGPHSGRGMLAISSPPRRRCTVR